MHPDYLKFRLPDDWTAEQVEFLSDFLQDLNETLLATYSSQLRNLWRERHRRRQCLEHPNPSSATETQTETTDDLPF